MIDLKTFRKDNNLTQAQVAEYLSVSSPFITQIEKGKNKLPEDHLDKLLNNDQGWNTTALQQDTPIKVQLESELPVRASIETLSKSAMAKEIQLLREQIEQLREQNIEYWELIKKLTSK